MSGGSYNYLCYKDEREIFGRDEDLQRMADRLAAFGYAKDAARETQELLLELRQYENRIRTRLDRLAPVWKAVEWVDSYDWSEPAIAEALAEYRGEHHSVKP